MDNTLRFFNSKCGTLYIYLYLKTFFSQENEKEFRTFVQVSQRTNRLQYIFIFLKKTNFMYTMKQQVINAI